MVNSDYYSANSNSSSNGATQLLPPSVNVRIIHGTSQSREQIRLEMLPLATKIAEVLASEFTLEDMHPISIEVDALSLKERQITLLSNHEKLCSFKVTSTKGNEVIASISDYFKLKKSKHELAENRHNYRQLSSNHDLVRDKIEKGKRAGKKTEELSELLTSEAQLVQQLGATFATMQMLETENERFVRKLFEQQGLMLKVDKDSIPSGETVWSRFDQLTTQMIDHVPDIPISHKPLTLCLPIESVYNNYGLEVTSYMEMRAQPKGNHVPNVATSVDDDSSDDKKIHILGGGIERSAESQTSEDEVVHIVDNFTTQRGGPFRTKFPAFVLEGKIYNSESTLTNCDFVATSKEKKIITLCDGCGQKRGAKRVAKTVAETALLHLEKQLGGRKSLKEVLMAHVESMKLAQAKLENEQQALVNEGTTFVQVSVTGDIAAGIAVGDSQVFAFIPKNKKEWDVVEISGNGKKTLDPENCGGRLGEDTRIDSTPDLLSGMRVFARKVAQNTVIFCCSDGVVDCFDPSINLQETPKDFGADEDRWDIYGSKHIPHARAGICRNIENAIRGCVDGSQILDRIQREIAIRVEDENMYMLIEGNNGYIPDQTKGKPVGKPDNASCAYVVV